MNKEELTNRIEEGFFDLAPDVFDKIVEATEQPVESIVLNISDIRKTKQSYKTLGLKMMSRVAMLALIIGLGIGTFGLYRGQENYVIALDVNPSIQLEMNAQYDVRKIKGLNADGEAFVEKLDWKKNSSVSETLDVITSELVSEGYLEEDGGILITLHKKNDEQDYEELKEIVNQELEKDVSDCGVNGVAVAFQAVDHKEKKSGQDVLKQRMVEQCNLDDAEVNNMSIRDMLDYVGENSKVQIFEETTEFVKDKTNQKVTTSTTTSEKATTEKTKNKTTKQTTTQQKATNKNTKETTTEAVSDKAEDKSAQQKIQQNKETTVKKEKNRNKEEDSNYPENNAKDNKNKEQTQNNTEEQNQNNTEMPMNDGSKPNERENQGQRENEQGDEQNQEGGRNGEWDFENGQDGNPNRDIPPGGIPNRRR